MKIKLIWSLLAGSLVVIGIGTVVSIDTTHHYPHFSPSTSATVNTIKPTKPIISEVFVLVNQERVNAGLPALVDDPRLDASAAAKCSDMVAKDYVAHWSPDGVRYTSFVDAQWFDSYYDGENLAWSYPTSQTTVTAWMNSPKHKDNILQPHFRYVGYAICNVDATHTNVVVQHFVGL